MIDSDYLDYTFSNLVLSVRDTLEKFINYVILFNRQFKVHIYIILGYQSFRVYNKSRLQLIIYNYVKRINIVKDLRR
jgi:hypothetical protein